MDLRQRALHCLRLMTDVAEIGRSPTGVRRRALVVVPAAGSVGNGFVYSQMLLYALFPYRHFRCKKASNAMLCYEC